MNTDTLDTFGAGIFETEATNVEPDPEGSDEQIVLTDREIAIAGGNDPDDPDAGNQIARDNEARAARAADDDDEDLDDVPPDEDLDDADPGGAEDDPTEWSQSDLRLAAMAGLTDEDLEKLPNVEALHSTIDVLSRHQQNQTNDNADDKNNETGTETPGDDNKATGAGEVSNKAMEALEKLTPIDLKEFEGYEGTDLKLIETVKQTQEAFKEAIKEVHGLISQQTNAYEQQRVAAAQDQVVGQFNDTLDKYPQIYGEMKDGKVPKAYQKARDEVRDQAQVIFQGHMARGTADKVDLDTIFAQAMRSVHGNQTRKKAPTTAQDQAAQADRRRKLQEQSRTRRSPGRKAASSKRVQTQSEDPAVIADDPELVEFYKNAQIENGVV